MKRKMILISVLVAAVLSAGVSFLPGSAQAANSYVGTATCAGCHDKEYANFSKFAKKAHSDRSIKVMAKKLTPEEVKECYACHTTGYNEADKAGGFDDLAKQAGWPTQAARSATAPVRPTWTLAAPRP